MKKALVGFLALTTFILSVQSSFAAFAIGNNASIAISKTVLDPQKNTYTHSLGLSDSMYHPGDIVTFHITVSNTGNVALSEILVKDMLPSFLTLTSGPGDFDKASNSLSYVAKDVAAHTTQTIAVSAKIADASKLPTNQGIVCTANKVSAKATTTSIVNDSSSFCIQKNATAQKQTTGGSQLANLQTTPATGPEALPLLGLFGSGITGLLLRKKSK